MLTGIGIGLVILFSLFLINKMAMKKIQWAFSALLGKGADKALRLDPIAVYKDRLEKTSEELRKAVTMLETQAGLIRQLDRKVESEQTEYQLIESRVKKCVQDGDTAKAEEYALNLVKIEDSLKHTKDRLESSKVTYANQTKLIKELKGTILSYKEKSERLKSDLQTSKTEADIAALTQKFDSKSLGFDDLKEIEDVIQEQIDTNESKASVAQYLHVKDIRTEILDEQKASRAKELIEKLSIK